MDRQVLCVKRRDETGRSATRAGAGRGGRPLSGVLQVKRGDEPQDQEQGRYGEDREADLVRDDQDHIVEMRVIVDARAPARVPGPVLGGGMGESRKRTEDDTEKDSQERSHA
jgi:hypothetical protein